MSIETNFAAQAGDEPLNERDIADLRNVIAVAERGSMPNLAAKAQAMLDAGVIPARAAKKITQAGDEPMRADFEREVLRLGIIDDEGLERRNDGSYVDDPAQAAWLTWKAAQVSPRATADVERDAIALLREVVRLDGISLVATIDNCDICTTIEFDKLTDDIRKYLATTKPGA